MNQVDALIAVWRAEVALVGLATDSEVAELEAHLRDATTAGMSTGVSPSAAFGEAVKRLGSPQRIASEFEKIRLPNRTRERLVWMLLGYVALEAVQSAARLLATAVAWGPFRLADSAVPIVLAVLHGVSIVAIGALLVRYALTSRPKGQRTPTRAWLVPVLTMAVFTLFATAAITVDYLQWWTAFTNQAIDRALLLTNHWIDLFELAVAPSIACAALMMLVRRGQRVPPAGISTPSRSRRATPAALPPSPDATPGARNI